jgi:hypothetical protein
LDIATTTSETGLCRSRGQQISKPIATSMPAIQKKLLSFSSFSMFLILLFPDRDFSPDHVVGGFNFVLFQPWKWIDMG